MLERNLTSQVLASLGRSRVTLVNGARQTGKTTLVRDLIAPVHPARYLTFDAAAVRASATADPDGFVASLEGPVVLDEVQLVPEIFRSIKLSVDRDRTPGRFLLTGSANVLMLPRLSESLAGRMEILTLWPLSQGEIAGTGEGFVDALFGGSLHGTAEATDPSDLARRMVRGGFPEAVLRGNVQDRAAWFGPYVNTIVQRDIRDLANIEGLTRIPDLLSLLAGRSSSLLNTAELSRTSGLPLTTLRRYLALFETAFLVQSVPAWTASSTRRLVKAPKVVVVDSGMAAHLLGADESRLLSDSSLFGRLLESFVAMELAKQLERSPGRPRLLHYRTHPGREVDLVLEASDGRVAGVEVKSARRVGPGDFAGLRSLASDTGERFSGGVVLYGGAETLPFGERLSAVPLSALWSTNAPSSPQSG
jgi:predicted AAA+ superfamily ATPase